MSIVKSIFVTAMGFFLGMVLAGVGGLSAETLFSAFSQSENSKKINEYWQDSGMGLADVEGTISNAKCYSSALYFRACSNAILNDQNSDISEKQQLTDFLKTGERVDFNLLLKSKFSAATQEKQAYLAGQLLNAFMSIYRDPHTYLLPTDFYNQVGSKIERSKYFVGISYEKDQDNIALLKVAKNSDADLAGLRAGDKILSINGRQLKGLDYSKISEILRDEKTEVIDFLIRRDAERQRVKLKRSYRMLSHVQFNNIGPDSRYTLLSLSKFSKGVCAEVEAGLKARSANSLAGLVLDLRDNPGGQLDEAACIAGLLLGKNKKAYYVEFLDPSKPNELVLTSEEQIYNGPLVVLVNSRSASAAESLAGALKDYRRGLIVGRKTFGKGSFQEPEEWPANAKVSLFKTQGFYLLPSRNATQLKGVKPDIELAAEGPEKREQDIYFRPLVYFGGDYPGLKPRELSKNPIAQNCKSNSVGKMEMSHDSFLQSGLDILNCQIKPRLSQTQNSETTIR